MLRDKTDVLVIGGGFFGLYIAEHLKRRFDDVLVCEKGRDLMRRASYINQARVHNGYHYPRSILTAFRSRINYPRFVNEFADSIDKSFEKIYAIGRRFSQVTAEQFRVFMSRIGAPVEPPSPAIRNLFDSDHIEDAFIADECAFDSVSLKNQMKERIDRAGVRLQLNTRVVQMRPSGHGKINVTTETPIGDNVIQCGTVFNCAYSQINASNIASNFRRIPLKHELAEICLVEVPEELRSRGVTVMCGPFFSCMPFPALGLHALSHVRYTPHFQWNDSAGARDPHSILDNTPRETAFPHMIRDVRRYMPLMAGCKYHGSLWEIKTVLPRSETDDSRPILFRPHHGIRNHHVVMGAKIDNIYDAVEEIDEVLTAA